jgi:hypothetical protein
MKVWTLGVPSSALALVGLALGLAGCPKGEPSQPGYDQPPTAPAQPEPEGQPPAGWEPYEPPGGRQGSAEPGMEETPVFAEALGQLRAYAQQMRASQDLQHKDVVAGFNALAAALRAMRNPKDTDVSAVERAAERMAASDPMSNEHADLAKNALSEGLRALEAMIKDQKIAGMDDRLAQIRTQIDAIDVATPLLRQKDAVASCFDQMAQVMDELSQRPPTGTQ